MGKRINVRIPDLVFDLINNKLTKEKTSMSDYIRKLIKEDLNGKEKN